MSIRPALIRVLVNANYQRNFSRRLIRSICSRARKDRLTGAPHFLHHEAVALAYRLKVADGNDRILYLRKLSLELVLGHQPQSRQLTPRP